jgi:hypothetical protein
MTYTFKTFSGATITRSWKGLNVAYHPRTLGKTDFPPSIHSSTSALNAAGTTAIARCAPGNPPAEAATFLGEIVKDGFPSIPIIRSWEQRTKAAQALGSEYLNAVFGWLPMINDIDKMSETIRHANKVLAQYERDAGKQVRRRYEFPIETSREEIVLSNSAGPAYVNGTFFYSLGKLTKIVETYRRKYFSGAFTYHLPTDYDSRNALDRVELLSKLLGAEVSPDTVWNLLPWSWAIDWVTNAGDVVNNLSQVANQGLVMRYGYMMEHTIVSHTYKLEGLVLNGPTVSGIATRGGPFDTNTISYVTETKQRVRANPFGFGLTWDGLSPFQASIAAALGLTHRR